MYVVRPERISMRQRFIDLAIEFSTDYEIDIEIADHFYYISVTMYLFCASIVGDPKQMISKLIGMCDRISSFTSKTDPCDFSIVLDYFTHDHYISDRKVDY